MDRQGLTRALLRDKKHGQRPGTLLKLNDNTFTSLVLISSWPSTLPLYRYSQSTEKMHHYDGNLLTAEDGNKFIAVFEISQKQQIFTAGFSPPVPDLAPTSIKLSFHDHDSLAGEIPSLTTLGPIGLRLLLRTAILKSRVLSTAPFPRRPRFKVVEVGGTSKVRSSSLSVKSASKYSIPVFRNKCYTAVLVWG